MKKFGFIIAPNKQVTGALELNRDIFNEISKEIKVYPVMPDTDFFYSLPAVGYLLNYFTLYKEVGNFEYIMGTSIATLPFVGRAKIIEVFHGSDTAGFNNVLDNVKNHVQKENEVMEKWLNILKEPITEGLEEITARLMISRATEGACINNSKAIIVVSPYAKNQLVETFKLDPKKVKVILNGIPDYWFEKSKADFVSKPKLVFTTRVNYSTYTFLEKGHDRAFEIMSRLKMDKNINIHFGTMHGDGKKKYIETIGKKTDSKIDVGLDREQLHKKYNPGQIFLSTSRTESFNLSLVEAMASKMVPVSFPTGIALSHIKNGINGFIVNNISEAIAVIEKLSKDSALRAKVGRAAYKTSIKDFRYDRMLDEYKKTIRSLIK